jgi:hypothetical protein
LVVVEGVLSKDVPVALEVVVRQMMVLVQKQEVLEHLDRVIMVAQDLVLLVL